MRVFKTQYTKEGFYSQEETEKDLKLNTVEPELIKQALEPESKPITLNSGPTKKNPKSYKDIASPSAPRVNPLSFDNFLKI